VIDRHRWSHFGRVNHDPTVTRKAAFSQRAEEAARNRLKNLSAEGLISALAIPAHRFVKAGKQHDLSHSASTEVRQELRHVGLADHVVDHDSETRIRIIRRRARGGAPR